MAGGQEESSLQGKKRLKRLKLAAFSISQQHGHEAVRISERAGSNPSPDQTSSAKIMSSPPPSVQRIPSPSPDLSNEVPNHEPVEEDRTGHVEEDRTGQMRKRGKTKLRTISLTPTKQVEMEFNERGQPIGVNSQWLSSYLGTLVRELVPFTYDDWRKVEETIKEDLFDCIKTRFKVEDSFKKLFIQMMGTRWRESKSRLIKSLRDASLLPNKESLIASLRPDNIRSIQAWNSFVAKKLSEEFEAKSKKFKQIRAKNKTPHTMSRKGYARLEEEMKKDDPAKLLSRDDVWCKGHTKKNGDVPNPFVAECVNKIKEITSSQVSTGNILPIKEDALSITLGPERNGRVRGMGFGITPSKIGIHINSSTKVHALESKVCDLTKEMSDVRNQNQKEISDLKIQNQKEISDLKNLLMQTLASKGIDNISTPSPDSQHGSSKVVGGRCNSTSDVGSKCKLLNWRKIAVAEATIGSKDPNDVVHHVSLGADAWKVWVTVALDPKAELYRPNSFMSLLEDAVGSTVAWPKDLISFD